MAKTNAEMCREKRQRRKQRALEAGKIDELKRKEADRKKLSRTAIKNAVKTATGREKLALQRKVEHESF